VRNEAKEKEMFEVIDKTGFIRGAFDNLATAMEAAKYVDEFVNIKRAYIDPNTFWIKTCRHEKISVL
jgi:hypothetical protein